LASTFLVLPIAAAPIAVALCHQHRQEGEQGTQDLEACDSFDFAEERRRVAIKKQRIVKAKTEAAKYQKLLALRIKEQLEHHNENLAKKLGGADSEFCTWSKTLFGSLCAAPPASALGPLSNYTHSHPLPLSPPITKPWQKL
jgi:hypothetical protein